MTTWNNVSKYESYYNLQLSRKLVQRFHMTTSWISGKKKFLKSFGWLKMCFAASSTLSEKRKLKFCWRITVESKYWWSVKTLKFQHSLRRGKTGGDGSNCQSIDTFPPTFGSLSECYGMHISLLHQLAPAKGSKSNRPSYSEDRCWLLQSSITFGNRSTDALGSHKNLTHHGSQVQGGARFNIWGR